MTLRRHARVVTTRAREVRTRSRLVDLGVKLVQKTGADRGGDLAAVIAYWTFFAVFPLLLALVTILDIVLQGDPERQEQILDSFLGTVPLLRQFADVEALTGDPRTVAVGLLVALWTGTKAVEALQRSMEVVWEVPFRERRAWLRRKAWSVVLLAVLGAGLLGATAVASIATILAELELIGRLASVVGSLTVNVLVLLTLYRLTSPSGRPSLVRLLPGAVLGGIAWLLLQYFGAFYIQRVIVNAGDTYGTFAFVIGLLTWFHLQSRIVVMSAEVDAVLAGRLGVGVTATTRPPAGPTTGPTTGPTAAPLPDATARATPR